MAIEASTKTEKIARGYKLTAEQLAFADLLSLGWDAQDAWLVAMRVGATWKKTALKTEIQKLKGQDGVQQRIEENRDVLRKAQKEKLKKEFEDNSDEILERATNKEKKLIALQTVLETLQPGSSEYNKINDQIFAITQMKKDEVKTDEKTIHYYLPVHYPTSCEDCLYSRCDQCRFKKDAEGK